MPLVPPILNPPPSVSHIASKLNNGKLIHVSSYCPKGNCNKEDVELLFQLTSSNFIIGGYVNNHHSLWEFHATLNRAGRAIVAALHDKNQVCLLTSSDIQTRLCLFSGLQSTIDLTFVHRDLLPNAAIYVGPHIGKDRMSIFVTASVRVERQAGGSPN